MLNLKKHEISYEVYDDQGRPVGCVILPRSQRVVGKNEGTVLLRRPAPKMRAATSPDSESRKAS
ncbi:MAG TPA: hypothetical protein VMK53_04735 [Gemmatimonadales bacterium]|nr:hypothetical protein [Gemmatimonadales bacterium]